AQAVVSVVVGVKNISLELMGSPGPHLIEVNGMVHLRGHVHPHEAVQNGAKYVWDLGIEQVSSFSSNFVYHFPVTGTHIIKVTILTEVSMMTSAPLLVNVVERLSARGIADHDSVMVHKERDFTVLVDHGSDIVYTWDFGDNSTKAITLRKTVSHTYEQTGVFNLTVHLQNPLGALLLDDKVFVLTPCLSPPCLTFSHCHTPKVPRIFPTDDEGIRKFDGGQSVLLEPTVDRDCPMGLGPQYLWQLFNQQGEELHLSGVNFTQPTLLIMPYTFGRDRPQRQSHVNVEALLRSAQINPEMLEQIDPSMLVDQIGIENLEKIASSDFQEQGSNSVEKEVVMPRFGISSILGPHVHPAFKGGVYQARLTIQEMGTPVYFTINTTFEVIGIPLRASFLGGYKREVDPVSNITLQVEVLAPYQNYTISWECNVAYETTEQCFKEQDAMDGFSSSVQHQDSLLVRLIKVIRGLLHSTDDGDAEGKKSKENNTNTTTESTTKITKTATNNITKTILDQSPDRSDADLEADQKRDAECPWDWSDHVNVHSNHRYLSTITVPIAALVLQHQDLVFKAKITYGKEKVNVQQLITIVNHRSHNVGIIRHIGHPLGAAKRLVFESECLTCSEEDLDHLLYTWDLKMVVSSWAGHGGSRSDYHGSSSSSRSDHIMSTALRNGQTAKGFIARPKDYRRVYNKSSLSWWEQQLGLNQKFPGEGNSQMLDGAEDQQGKLETILQEVAKKFGVGADVVNRARDIVTTRIAHKQQLRRRRRSTTTT
ncbi:unnamed protein product, partial [Meganyctiphanes norvegica]